MSILFRVNSQGSIRDTDYKPYVTVSDTLQSVETGIKRGILFIGDDLLCIIPADGYVCIQSSECE